VLDISGLRRCVGGSGHDKSLKKFSKRFDRSN